MTKNVLLVTIGSGDELYDDGLNAIQALKDGESIDAPAIITFPNEKMLSDVFNDRTYTLLRTIREEQPTSIRETAALVDRDKKNVHEELTTLEALGAISFEDDGYAKKPTFPYSDLIIKPFRSDENASVVA
ncbi:hypothetical protein C491_11648 [Natronococcus amylolyticus DSM 10524]|uniref:Uncharacterized protein n=1 Tax=Natronococcus amylolyticus DSM 10524 TaxID=1227497 RepID=L9X946_9EURY|nr:hypothetical protein [Natronococcus amylolyticus]ELY57153.1 hypothetical protein C491_11648 [Natronococcus amylolyticus DSM 10524]